MASGQPGRAGKWERPGYITRARWAALWLIVFMLVMATIPFIPFAIDSTGYVAAFVKEWLFIILWIYLAIEFDETSRRSATNQEGFFKDNGLAFLGVLTGFGTFLLWGFVPGYKLTPDQFHIVLQCMLAVTFDFAYGVIISQRIAFAGKEREEVREH